LQVLQVDHNLKVLPPHSQTLMAQFKFVSMLQGAAPELQELQFMELIYQSPIS
jgi:hypothetical protein